MKKTELINRPHLICNECKMECISCDVCGKLFLEGEVYCNNNFSDKSGHYCLSCIEKNK